MNDRRNQREQCRADRRGQALVEFAIVALVLYLLLAAIIEFGRLTWVSQTVQSAADTAAREIARMPLPAAATLDNPEDENRVIRPGTNSMNPADPKFLVGRTTYSEDFLALRMPNAAEQGNQSLFEYFDTKFFADGRQLPLVNRMLLPIMIVTDVNGTKLLRYPGALVTSNTADSGYTVKVPIAVSSGTDQFVWRNVVEEMKQPDGDSDPNNNRGYFSVVPPEQGLVALRINYPFQAAAMSGFRQPDAPSQGNLNRPIVADDGGVAITDDRNVLNGGTPVAPDSPLPGMYGGPYGGTYGLGELGALNSPQLANDKPVRPFRRVVTGQAATRREVFGN